MYEIWCTYKVTSLLQMVCDDGHTLGDNTHTQLRSERRIMHKTLGLSNIQSLEKILMTKKYHHLPCASLCCCRNASNQLYRSAQTC